MDQIKAFYKRNLPHFQLEYSYYFITFRLHNSLPKKVVESLKIYYRNNKKIILKTATVEQRSSKLYDLQKRYFGIFDNHLDKNIECINYLSDPRISKIVADSILYWEKIDYETIAYCIMPNHVHVVMYVERFRKPFYNIMQSIKRYSARESNKIINRTGTFWHEETYDHIVRDKAELNRIIKYVIHNPVKAGLVKRESDWKNTFKIKTSSTDF